MRDRVVVGCFGAVAGGSAVTGPAPLAASTCTEVAVGSLGVSPADQEVAIVAALASPTRAVVIFLTS